MDLKNKAVIITGGSRGLGRALAVCFLKEGSKVIVCSRNADELKNLENGIIGIKADVTKEIEIQALSEKVIKDFNGIDIWINNAGIWLPHLPIEETDWKRAHNLMEVNLFGMVYGSKTALAQMRKQGFGFIVNIISTSGLDGKKDETAYCASKFAATGFTRSLAKEVDGKKIKILGVYPGGMKTNLFDENKPKNYNEFMDPNFVAQKIIENLKLQNPETELILRRK